MHSELLMTGLFILSGTYFHFPPVRKTSARRRSERYIIEYYVYKRKELEESSAELGGKRREYWQ